MSAGSYQQFCPVAMARDPVARAGTHRWLREMFAGSTRFNELRRGVPRMSPALLSQRLRSWKWPGLLPRGVGVRTAVFEYRLTEIRRELGLWWRRSEFGVAPDRSNCRCSISMSIS